MEPKMPKRLKKSQNRNKSTNPEDENGAKSRKVVAYKCEFCHRSYRRKANFYKHNCEQKIMNEYKDPVEEPLEEPLRDQRVEDEVGWLDSILEDCKPIPELSDWSKANDFGF